MALAPAPGAVWRRRRSRGGERSDHSGLFVWVPGEAVSPRSGSGRSRSSGGGSSSSSPGAEVRSTVWFAGSVHLLKTFLLWMLWSRVPPPGSVSPPRRVSTSSGGRLTGEARTWWMCGGGVFMYVCACVWTPCKLVPAVFISPLSSNVGQRAWVCHMQTHRGTFRRVPALFLLSTHSVNGSQPRSEPSSLPTFYYAISPSARVTLFFFFSVCK